MAPVSVTSGTDGVLEVALRGEIDYTNAGPVTGVVRDAVARSAPTVVRVDLSEVTFLDSSGIGVLVIAFKVAQAAGASYTLRGPDPKIFDQLEITGLLDLFPVEES